MRKRARMLTAVAVAALVVAGGSAYTNANTVDDNNAGQGVGDTTGFNVTEIAYGFDTTTTPLNDNVQTVTFKATPINGILPATAARARLLDLTGPPGAPLNDYVDCDPPTGLDALTGEVTFTCDWTTADAQPAEDIGGLDAAVIS